MNIFVVSVDFYIVVLGSSFALQLSHATRPQSLQHRTQLCILNIFQTDTHTHTHTTTSAIVWNLHSKGAKVSKRLTKHGPIIGQLLNC